MTAAVHRMAGNLAVDYVEVPQDGRLADNQSDGIRCGDVYKRQVYGAFAFLSNLPQDDKKYVDRLLIISPLSAFGPWELELSLIHI